MQARRLLGGKTPPGAALAAGGLYEVPNNLSRIAALEKQEKEIANCIRVLTEVPGPGLPSGNRTRMINYGVGSISNCVAPAYKG